MCLVTSLVGSGGKADCVAGADRVIFCEVRMRRNFSLLMDFQLAEGHAQWRDGSQSDPQCALGLLADLSMYT